MLKKLWTACLSTVALFALAATLCFTLTPQAVASAAPAFEIRYEVGEVTPGTHITNCPVPVGNSLCAIVVSPADEAAQ